MEELRFIEQFLRSQAPYACEKYAARSEVTMTSKSYASDMLTEADLTIQQRAVEALEQAFPNDVLVAEEGDYATLPSDSTVRAWVLDPIDGTNNFVRGMYPVFGISLAFVEGGVTQAGGVMLPVTDDLFLAARGQGATRNGKTIQVSEVHDMEAARVEIEFGWLEEREEMLRRAPDVIRCAGQIRTHGSAVASLCQIACGDLDGLVHMTLHPWDYAASQVIIEEAGGLTSRLDGSTLLPLDGRKGVLAGNGAIHQALKGLIRP